MWLADSLSGALLDGGELTAPLLIGCRSTGPTEAKSCQSCHEAAGLVAVDRPLIRTLIVCDIMLRPSGEKVYSAYFLKG